MPAAINALHYPNFRNYLISRLLATIAMQMQGIAIGWQVYQLTDSFSALGLIGLVQFIPFALLVLVAGQVADRYDRRLIINICMVVQLINSAVLLFFVLGGFTSIWPVYAVLALQGTARAFALPASKAIVINLVPLEAFSSATAMSSSTFSAATIIGPVIGGLLYTVGPQMVYTTALVLMLFGVVLMAGVRTAQTRMVETTPISWQNMREGLSFVWHRPIVLGAISLDLFAVLFGGCTAVLPAYAKDVLHVGPEALGLLRTAPAVGAVLMAALLAFYPIQRHVGRWMFAGVGLFGFSTVVFGLSHEFWLSLIMLFLLGVGDMASVYIRQILIQLETPDALRGRVSAVSSMFIGAPNELGEFESGMAAGLFGLVPSVVIGGVTALFITGIWSTLFPGMRAADRFNDQQSESQAKPNLVES